MACDDSQKTDSDSDIRKISNAESADLIHAIFQAAYRVEADLIGVQTFPPLNRTKSEIGRSSNDFYAISHYDNPVGIMEIEEPFNSGKTSTIASLAISPDFSRMGLGQRLVQFAIEQGCPLRVTTAEKNMPAVRLYEKMGFEFTRQFFTPEKISIVAFTFCKEQP